METIKEYLKGIEPFLKNKFNENSESLAIDFNEDIVNENNFIDKLLKEIEQLTTKKD